jgi:hypothetical protein
MVSGVLWRTWVFLTQRSPRFRKGRKGTEGAARSMPDFLFVGALRAPNPGSRELEVPAETAAFATFALPSATFALKISAPQAPK